jgi:hypothetical protein
MRSAGAGTFGIHSDTIEIYRRTDLDSNPYSFRNVPVLSNYDELTTVKFLFPMVGGGGHYSPAST